MPSVLARLAAGLDTTGECWLWTGKRNSKGYGRISIHNRYVLTHRVAWETEHGPIPAGMCILHKCDTPLCNRPAHLVLGTFGENSRDMVRKRRNYHETKPHLVPNGTRTRHAKLDDAKVAEIRARHAAGGPVVAADYGVSARAIEFVLTRHTWKHVHP